MTTAAIFVSNIDISHLPQKVLVIASDAVLLLHRSGVV